MKVYKFFKLPNKQLMRVPDSEFSLRQKYPLYAITTDKKLARDFQKQRNMKKFLYVEDKMSDVEADAYITAMRSRLIDRITYKTQSFNKKIRLADRESCSVEIVMTDSEFDLIAEYGDTGQIISIIGSMISPHIFQEEMFDALHSIGYDTMFKLSMGEEPFMESTPFSFDYFRIFLCIYGDTLSKDFFKEVKFVN